MISINQHNHKINYVMMVILNEIKNVNINDCKP